MTPSIEDLARLMIRNVGDVPLVHETRPPLYDTLSARLGTGTAARKLGASFDRLAPGARSCPYHFHRVQEELFFVIAGRGTFRVAGRSLPVKAGDVVFVPPGPDHPHQMINTSDAPLEYLSVSTRETPDIVEYPDSGKYAVMLRGADGGLDFDVLQRPSDPLDYWDGEP